MKIPLPQIPRCGSQTRAPGLASPLTVTIHSTQFPWIVQQELRDSLASRQINQKFLYDSYRQTQKWLQLHQAYSPSRTDPDCQGCFDAAFVAAAEEIRSAIVHLIGLGCGGGQKDARLLGLLQTKTTRLFYSPVDVSTAMVLTAGRAASSFAAESNPLVCDLSSADDLTS